MFKIEQAQRLQVLPPYLFAEIDRKKEECRAKGIDIISLGIGDPDRPTPDHIINRLGQAVKNSVTHRYPTYNGMKDFRQAVADWYGNRLQLNLDPDEEILALIGSKEGIAHIPLAFVNPGDTVLIPDPGYPVYKIGTSFAGGVPYFMPLLEENEFLPDFSAIPADIAKKAKMMFVNYPNNPTAADASLDFYQELVEFAREYEIIVLNDAAYSEIYFDGYETPSFLQAPGALEVGIEIQSLSKTYNMTGWRIGWVAGRAEVVRGLASVKENIDSGVFEAIQLAGIEALRGDQTCVEEMRKMYARRRDVLIAGLRDLGLSVKTPHTTFYLWARLPDGYTSANFTTKLLEETGVVCTPGNGFGPSGEGYVRFALTQEEDRLEEAVSRIKKLQL
ncbi:MAG: LL-diaminopimelate aminotransferase [Deltaproteobacteria bacterium]|nr:LL-diaminopimelate aminotransferase [Deltaproteobacteria bacterium]MBW2052276.1 LL-diaminopimelate aminotransferase [Deltaproteobacteria bacterium]MBW2140596.1 LL-diaminopimelate aminotransferase [Deltaproteobacteria bacterium]MBW2324208.1 LL-diaminopimelate aminotransferase [Deltaproteobacteria bacterium]